MRIEYHRTLVADRVRVDAYEAALAKVIRKGETVVADIGTGTGLLAFIAAKLGARRVYAYEQAEIGAVAEKLARVNKLRNIEIIPANSTEVMTPPRVDVVVTETLGNYALEEDLLETMNDARARHLAPGGVLIPATVTQLCCPIVAPRCFKELTLWDDIGRGIDFSAARKMSLNNAYVRSFPAAELLDGGKAAKVWDSIDLAQRNKLARKGSVSWSMERAVTVYGLALWWTAGLAPGIDLSTSPLSAPTHWEQLYFPALEPIDLKAGETLGADLRSTSSREGGTDLGWTFTVTTAKGQQRLKQALSLEKGFLP